MNVLINGETILLDDGATLEFAIKELQLEGKVMAAAVNMEIVKQANWCEHRLKDGDKVELLDFVGGG